MHEQRFYTKINDFLWILFFCAFSIWAFVSQLIHTILQPVFCAVAFQLSCSDHIQPRCIEHLLFALGVF